ncbi:mucin-2-like [Episyrphus balteatus]|uniref:mucin-2-like n=1 Tax=Episyrphus balteatus TaxID=286459 RepID=UPI002485A75F|nr:mucin-2-like [Episyrphus balteatus]
MRVLIGIIILCFCAYVNCDIFPECDGIPSRSYVASSRKNGCRSFIFCNGEKSFEDSCPLKLAFNPVEETCDLKENVECDDDEDDYDIDDVVKMSSISPTRKSSISSKKPITATTKQHPTPPGKPLKTTKKNSPTKSTTLGKSSKRPVPTRKPLGSTTKKPKTNSPTKLTSLIQSTTKKYSPTLSPNRPSSKKPSPSTTVRPKTSSTSSDDSPIRLPTPPQGGGGHYVPDRPKKPISPTTLSDESYEEDSTWLPTEVTSKTKKLSSRPSPTTKTTTTMTTTSTETELLASSEETNDIDDSIQEIREECRKKFNGSFAYPGECKFYYRCISGHLSKQECPRSFGWDAKSKMCTSKGCSKK